MLALMSSAAVLPRLRAGEPAFDRIDVHAHIFRSIPAMIANMEKEKWRALTICVSQAFDDTPMSQLGFKSLDEMFAAAAKVHRESQGRIAWAATFDARGFEHRDFAEKTIASLQQCFKDGAVAVKIWKNIGMKIRGKDGKFLMPDNKALLPVYEFIQKQDRTLLAHLAEPNGAWLPIDSPDNNDSAYYKKNPMWHAQPGDPAKETILLARDRVLARLPKLRFVGCHLGSNEEDLTALAKRLDTYPNFCVDTAARIPHLFHSDTQAVHQFVEKYQDRLLYGSDFNMGNVPEDRVATSFTAQDDREWNLLATDEKVTLRGREVQSLALPEPVLRKIFYDNAVRVIPGIV
jgi:hypothetical protein